MLCGISGEAPQEPVASKKTGIVYEKRLIEQYINEHGSEPNGEAITADDLLPITSSRIPRPRPPTLTSIPALLATFQNEWDNLALETYNLREQLARTREELSTALYQHDAAVRVIARLTRERDEARDSLSKVTVTDGAANGEGMVVDSVEALPEDLAAQVDEIHQSLSKGRKKRSVPEGWVSSEEVSSFETTTTNALPVPQATSFDLEGNYAVAAGLNGEAAIYSVEADNVERTVPVNEPVTDALWAGSKVFFATSQGNIKVYEAGNEVGTLSEHAGAASGLSLHPSGDLLASVGADKSIVFYHLETMKRVSRAYADSSLTTCAFHPDGHLFAAGTVSGDIKLYMTKTLDQAVVFKLGAPVQALVFSENGFLLAATAKGQTSVTIFDLRKEGDAAVSKVLETGGSVQSLAWDYTGQFLATGGSTGITVQQYTKSSKKWSEPLRNSVPAVAVRWGESGQKLVSLNGEGVVSVLGVKN
ncbi:Prp19 domain-containing protein [Trichoderma chlorosporum]